jgi:hypothetical protein
VLQLKRCPDLPANLLGRDSNATLKNQPAYRQAGATLFLLVPRSLRENQFVY